MDQMSLDKTRLATPHPRRQASMGNRTTLVSSGTWDQHVGRTVWHWDTSWDQWARLVFVPKPRGCS